MRKLLLLLLLINTAHAADSVLLPNLNKQATGTSLGGGKYGLDINLPPGAVSVAGSVATGSVFGASDVGLLTHAVRKDATGALTGVADGDYSPLQVDSNGNLKVAGSFSEVATAADGALGLPSLLKVVGGFDGTNVRAIKTTAAGDVSISAASLPLPTGASTSALQTTGNTSLSNIDGKMNSLGQKTMANSMPVVIASDQSAIPITGSITSTNSANGATGAAVPADATQVGGSDGTNLRALSVNSSGQLNVNNISGTISLPTGAATSANQTTANSSLSSIDGKIPSNLTVTSTRLLVDGSGVTQPVSAASLPLPTGASTEATLSALNGKFANDAGASSAAVRVVQATGSVIRLTDGTDNTDVTAAGELEVDPTTIKATSASAIPTTGAFMMGSDGTNARPIKTNTAGELVVGVTQSTPATSSFVQDTVDAVTADVNTPPANCRGFQLFATEANTANLRVRYGATSPTTTVGVQLQPGRSVDYVPACPSIRIISENGTQEYQIAWFTD